MWDVIKQRSLLIREPNEVRILRLVRDSGEISRVEIANACNLNKAYVTELVAKLIQAGFLETSGKDDAVAKVGRKRILLRFVPMAGLVAGVDVGMSHTTVIVTDLNATILQRKTFTHSVETPAPQVLTGVTDAISSLLLETHSAQSRLVGIGLGVQGLIDYRTNRLITSYNKQSWEGQSLSELLEAHFKVPMYVENDVKAMTVGEYLLGSAKGSKNLVNLFIGDGLGAGIMINGHLHRGFTSSAGEIGYTELPPASHMSENFPLLYNGQTIFGQILTDANIAQSYAKKAGRDRGETSVVAIAEKEGSGDPLAKQIVEECASLLSMLCINLINLLNPELIIIGGKFAQSCPTLIELVRTKIHKDALSVPAEAVQVRAASHGAEAVALGATSLVLYEMFEPLHSLSLDAERVRSVVDTDNDLSKD